MYQHQYINVHPPSVEDQRRIIRDATKDVLVSGDIWYLVDMHWYQKWKKYIEHACTNVVNESDHPGPIDNASLFQSVGSKLKEHLLDGSGYKLISAVGWNTMVSWYSLVGNQHAIPRIVAEQGIYNKQLKVEVYLIELKLCLFTNLENQFVKEYSKTTTIADVVEEMKTMFGILDEQVRVWNKFMKNTFKFIGQLSQTLQDAGIGSGQMLVLEQKNQNNEWPRQTNRSRSIQSNSSIGTLTVLIPSAQQKKILDENTISKALDSYCIRKMKEEFSCSICNEIADKAVETSCCHHVFCEECLYRMLGKECPKCRENFQIIISHIGRRINDNMPANCRFENCRLAVTHSTLKDHEHTCKHRLYSCPAAGCSFQGTKPVYVSHLLKSHQDEIAENAHLCF